MKDNHDLLCPDSIVRSLLQNETRPLISSKLIMIWTDESVCESA